MVIMDREVYIDKTNNLLVQSAYKPLPRDPTNRIKAKCITILREVKKETGLDDSTYKYKYPMGYSSPNFYGLPKIHKPDTPQRPIMSRKKDQSLVAYPRYSPGSQTPG